MPEATIHIRVPQEQKERWEQYADEHHYGTLTGLIKESVAHTINDGWVLESDSTVTVDQSELGVDKIEDDIETINAKIDELIVTQTPGDTQSEPLTETERINLADKCRDRLPTAVSDDHLENTLPPTEHPDPVEHTGTVEDIADYFAEPEPTIWEALNYLENADGSQVHSTVIDGKRHWYVLDPDAPSQKFQQLIEDE